MIQSLNNMRMSQNECLDSKANIHAIMFLPQTAFFPRAAVSFYTQACVYISGDEVATHETRAEVNQKSGADAGLQLEDETFV